MLVSAEQIEDKILSQGFHVIDNFLKPHDYQNLLTMAKEMYSQGQFRGAKIGHQLNTATNTEIRKDQICWLDEDPTNSALKAYFAKIQGLAQSLNQTLFLGLVEFEAHFAIYQPGSYYKKHVDQFKTTKARRISCVYYLNENWQNSFGGQLKLYGEEERLLASILPQNNRFVYFNSDMLHEVCETKETRYSITGWLKTRASLC